MSLNSTFKLKFPGGSQASEGAHAAFCLSLLSPWGQRGRIPSLTAKALWDKKPD